MRLIWSLGSVSLWLFCYSSFAQLNIAFTDPPGDLSFARDEVKYVENVAYDTSEPSRQDFNLFVPDTIGAYPLVIYLHGGGFTGGSKTSGHRHAPAFVDQGVAFASMGYSLLEEGDKEGIIKPLMDVKRGIQFIRHYASSLKIDPSRIALYGNSAGAGTALWIATHDDFANPESTDSVEHASTTVSAVALSQTQASYDFVKWHQDVFEEWNGQFSLEDMIAHINGIFPNYFDIIYGGATLDELLNEPELIDHRRNLNMLDLISEGDPSIYLITWSSAADPLTPSFDILHHAFHPLEVFEKASLVGVEVSADIAALGINTTEGEGPKEFLVRQLKEVNQSPVITEISHMAVDEDKMLGFFIEVVDDGLPSNSLMYSLDEESSNFGMSLNDSSGRFSWIPDESQDGEYTVTVMVSDGELSDQQSFAITVNEVNQAPVLDTIHHQQIDEETLLNISLSATDPDVPEQDLTYSLQSAPSGMVISENNQLNWIPDEAQDGEYTVTVTVDDGALSDHVRFNILVHEVNQAPVVNEPIEDFAVNEGFDQLMIDLANTYQDPDGHGLTLAATSSDKVVAKVWIDDNALIIKEEGVGICEITIAATDEWGASEEETFTISIMEVLSVDKEPPIGISIYPNPFEDDLVVMLSGSYQGKVSMQLMDLSGKVYQDISVVKDKKVFEFNISNEGMPAGTYLIVIETNFFRSGIKVRKE